MYIYGHVHITSDQLYEPEKQMEMIFVFASRYFKRGMRAEHLKAVGKVSTDCLRVCVLVCVCVLCLCVFVRCLCCVRCVCACAVSKVSANGPLAFFQQSARYSICCRK